MRALVLPRVDVLAKLQDQCFLKMYRRIPLRTQRSVPKLAPRRVGESARSTQIRVDLGMKLGLNCVHWIAAMALTESLVESQRSAQLVARQSTQLNLAQQQLGSQQLSQDLLALRQPSCVVRVRRDVLVDGASSRHRSQRLQSRRSSQYLQRLRILRAQIILRRYQRQVRQLLPRIDSMLRIGRTTYPCRKSHALLRLALARAKRSLTRARLLP
jgi:hypothetical protein